MRRPPHCSYQLSKIDPTPNPFISKPHPHGGSIRITLYGTSAFSPCVPTKRVHQQMLPLSACMDLTESKTCSTTSVFKLNHCYQSTNTGHVVYSLEIDFALFKDANHGSFDLDVVSVPPFCVKLQLTLLSEPVDYYSTIIGVCSMIRCQSSAQK